MKKKICITATTITLLSGTALLPFQGSAMPYVKAMDNESRELSELKYGIRREYNYIKEMIELTSRIKEEGISIRGLYSAVANDEPALELQEMVDSDFKGYRESKIKQIFINYANYGLFTEEGVSVSFDDVYKATQYIDSDYRNVWAQIVERIENLINEYFNERKINENLKEKLLDKLKAENIKDLLTAYDSIDVEKESYGKFIEKKNSALQEIRNLIQSLSGKEDARDTVTKLQNNARNIASLEDYTMINEIETLLARVKQSVDEYNERSIKPEPKDDTPKGKEENKPDVASEEKPEGPKEQNPSQLDTNPKEGTPEGKDEKNPENEPKIEENKPEMPNGDTKEQTPKKEKENTPKTPEMDKEQPKEMPEIPKSDKKEEAPKVTPEAPEEKQPEMDDKGEQSEETPKTRNEEIPKQPDTNPKEGKPEGKDEKNPENEPKIEEKQPEMPNGDTKEQTPKEEKENTPKTPEMDKEQPKEMPEVPKSDKKEEAPKVTPEAPEEKQPEMDNKGEQSEETPEAQEDKQPEMPKEKEPKGNSETDKGKPKFEFDMGAGTTSEEKPKFEFNMGAGTISKDKPEFKFNKEKDSPDMEKESTEQILPKAGVEGSRDISQLSLMGIIILGLTLIRKKLTSK